MFYSFFFPALDFYLNYVSVLPKNNNKIIKLKNIYIERKYIYIYIVVFDE